MAAFAIKPQGDLGPRHPRQHDRKHLAFIRQLPCVSCGRRNSEAAHVRYGSLDYGKRETGLAEKPDDKWIAPLCSQCHREGSEAQHNANEFEWWCERRIDPLALASELYAVSGDIDAGMAIVRYFMIGESA